MKDFIHLASEHILVSYKSESSDSIFVYKIASDALIWENMKRNFGNIFSCEYACNDLYSVQTLWEKCRQALVQNTIVGFKIHPFAILKHMLQGAFWKKGSYHNSLVSNVLPYIMKCDTLCKYEELNAY